MPYLNPIEKFTTADEIQFLADLRVKNAVAFQKYASLVVRGMRRYDSTVNVSEVKQVISRSLAN